MGWRAAIHVAVVAAAVVAAACAGDGAAAPGEAPAISREAFVAAYVDLRVADLRSVDGPVSGETRAEILAEHGLTEDDLLEFVEVHGTDVRFMVQVWNEIDQTLSDLRTQADSVGV